MKKKQTKKTDGYCVKFEVSNRLSEMPLKNKYEKATNQSAKTPRKSIKSDHTGNIEG